MGNTLLDILKMIYLNSPDLDGKDACIKLIGRALVALLEFTHRYPARSWEMIRGFFWDWEGALIRGPLSAGPRARVRGCESCWRQVPAAAPMVCCHWHVKRRCEGFLHIHHSREGLRDVGVGASFLMLCESQGAPSGGREIHAACTFAR